SDQVTGIPWYLGTITETGDSYKKWDYTKIRHINEAIFKLESSVIEDKDAVDFMLGQAYFMRAYM
ncbi:MAG TPA: RagB/SusD family nutrient uptake outer membrane protein, partial [Parabacteroides distasonis]|nr:RagB/SusD family nutrient uptake outer membrane protein [Parabacteroides distasonis]